LDTPLKIGDGLYRKERPSPYSASPQTESVQQTDAVQQSGPVADSQSEPEPENEPEPEAGPEMGMRF
jgi:hypothetical protein